MGLLVSVATILSALCDVFGVLKPLLLPLMEPIAWLARPSQERSRVLVESLGSENPQRRQAAGRALQRIGAPAVPLLIDAVGDMTNGALRKEASHILPRIGLSAIKPMIVARYTDHEEQNPKTFDLLDEALSQLKKSQAVTNHLLELLTAVDSDWQIKQGSAFTLGAIRDAQAIQPLCHVLDNAGSERLEVRQEAALALGEIGNIAARPCLIQALCDDVDWGVRTAAAAALGKIKGAEAVTPLIAALDDDRRVTEKAATALGLIGDDRAVGPLIHTLQRPEPKVREAVVQALGEIGSVEAIPALLQRIEEDIDENVRYFAQEALIAIDTGEAIEQLDEAALRALEKPIQGSEKSIQDRLALIYDVRNTIKQDMDRRRSGYVGFDA